MATVGRHLAATRKNKKHLSYGNIKYALSIIAGIWLEQDQFLKINIFIAVKT